MSSLHQPPYLYPAFLSHVAAAFRARVPLATHVRDSVEHRFSFLGSEAVDTISFVINSTDRNLALVIGRCLDAQGFIFDVGSTGARLKDNSDLYKMVHDPRSPRLFAASLDPSSAETAEDLPPVDPPLGVFMLLTDCYSPTCSMEDLCYSVACPRRLFQLQSLATKFKISDVWSSSTVLQNQIMSDEKKRAEEDLWWSNTVPKEVLESVSKEEEKRQNAIYDIIKTERNYVEELKIIQSLYANPLRESNIIDINRLDSFMKTVFCNASELLNVNSKLLAKLLARQKETNIVEKIGDIFISCAGDLKVYIEYCGNREYSRNDIALEKNQNAKFKEFLAKAIVKTDSRQETKHELDGYLHKPIARMASYLLLLKAILERTPLDHPDRILIPQATTAIQEVLGKMNTASGKTMNKIKLMQLSQQIFSGEDDLKLLEPDRQHIYEGKLILKRSAGDYELTVFLFDNLLVMTRRVNDKKAELKGIRYKLYKHPIRYELILATQEPKKTNPAGRTRTDFPRKSDTIRASPTGTLGGEGSTPTASTSPAMAVGGSIHGIGKSTGGPPSIHSLGSTEAKVEHRLQFTLTVVGREVGGTYTFQAETESGRNIWREHINKLRSKELLRGWTFSMHQRAIDSWNLGVNSATPAGIGGSVVIMVNSSNAPPNSTSQQSTKILCCCSAKGRLIIGTELGLYVGPNGSLENPSAHSDQFVQILEMEKISQVDVVEEHSKLLVLADKALYSYNLSILNEQNDETRKHKTLGEGINFFKLGLYQGRTLVCTVRAAPLSSTIKIFETVEDSNLKKKKRIANLLSWGAADTMKAFKEFYIPTEASSIYFLKTKMVIGCPKGFEIVDLETLETQALLDPSDDSLDFVLVREDTKPIAIFKTSETEYLLCYDEFGFYVDRMGRRARGEKLIHWAGKPQSFAYIAPYILAFEPNFICIRNVQTCEFVQIVYANNVKLLQATPGNDYVLGVSIGQAGFEDRQSLFKLHLLTEAMDDEADLPSVGVLVEGDEDLRH
ncbi:CNH domain-containing protein [Chytriomyces sp. MP71]|nr:CNH domain-containing protein [Chytriomyces sp. MP71]